MHTKQKGALGVSAIIKDLLFGGHKVFIEFGDLSKTDIIVLVNDSLPIKLQVKSYAIDKRSGTVILYRKSSGPNYSYKYNSTQIDGFALYVLDTGDIAYISEDEIKDSLALRFDCPRNNQQVNVHYIADYRNFTRLLRGHTRGTHYVGEDMVQTATAMASES